MGAPHSSQCADRLQTLTIAYKERGVPLASGKCEGPTSRLTFLGIEMDTVAWSLHLPAVKLMHSHQGATLLDWNDRKACRRRELESLVVLLAFFSTPAGRQAWTLVPSAHDKPAVRPIRLEGTLYSAPQQRFPRGSRLVEHLHIRLERRRPHAQTLRRACSFLLRRSGSMGLRGVLESPLVADCMGCAVAATLHFCKTDAFHHPGGRSLGWSMAWEAGYMLLRQPSCGCRPLVPRMPGRPPHAHAALPILHRGIP